MEPIIDITNNSSTEHVLEFISDNITSLDSIIDYCIKLSTG